MSLRKIIITVNVGLFCIVLLAAATHYIWHNKRILVLLTEKFLISQHVDHHQARLKEALSLVDTDTEAGLVLLEDFQTSVVNVKRGDRLDEKKRAGLKKLVEIYQEQEHYPRAIYWAQRWAAQDDKDLLAQVALIEALIENSTSEDRGVEKLKALYAVVPELSILQWPFAKMQIRSVLYLQSSDFQDNDSHDAGSQLVVSSLNRILESYLNDTIRQFSWEMFWDLKHGFNAKDSKIVAPQALESGRLAFTIDLPKNTQKLRVDLPSASEWLVESGEFRYVFGKQAELVKLVKLADRKPKLHHMKPGRDKGSIYSFGRPDPYFYVEVPKQVAKTKFSVTFSADVRKSFSARAKKFIASPEYDQIVGKWRDRGEMQIVELLQVLKSKARG